MLSEFYAEWAALDPENAIKEFPYDANMKLQSFVAEKMTENVADLLVQLALDWSTNLLPSAERNVFYEILEKDTGLDSKKMAHMSITRRYLNLADDWAEHDFGASYQWFLRIEEKKYKDAAWGSLMKRFHERYPEKLLKLIESMEKDYYHALAIRWYMSRNAIIFPEMYQSSSLYTLWG